MNCAPFGEYFYSGMLLRVIDEMVSRILSGGRKNEFLCWISLLSQGMRPRWGVGLDPIHTHSGVGGLSGGGTHNVQEEKVAHFVGDCV